MFSFCLSPDTTGDGTGCDNMTCMIVSFAHLNGGKIKTTTGAVKRVANNEEEKGESKKPKVEDEKNGEENSEKNGDANGEELSKKD